METMVKKMDRIRVKINRIAALGLVSTVAASLLSGCNLYNLLNPTPTPRIPTATSIPAPKQLTICTGYEPQSLYPYKASSQVAQDILQAIYDGPVDMLDGQPTPVILENLPSQESGGITAQAVSLTQGEAVVNTEGDLVSLQPGTRVFPSGCSTASCALAWDGSSPLEVDQLTATYRLLPGLKWSDGQPLTASDAVYAFELAQHPSTPVSKKRIDLTADYSALDDLTVQWVGKPGLVAEDAVDFFWAPLPQHAWGAYSPQELLTREETNRAPLGWGPFMLGEWIEGESIRLVRNPYYFRADEGLPKVDEVIFQIIQDSDQLLDDSCDIVSDSAVTIENLPQLLESATALDIHANPYPANQLEMLAIGITPSSYDDNYYPYGVDRPDIFGDERVRKAIAYCIDRDTIVNKLLGGTVEKTELLLSANYPFVQGIQAEEYPFNPTKGQSLLDDVGWRDLDLNPSTPLTAGNVVNVPPGTKFDVTLAFSRSTLRGEIAAEIAAHLAECGIGVNLNQLPVDQLYQPGPDGLLFGRQFDLALLSWQIAEPYDCTVFTTAEIPSADNYWLGEKSGGANFSGYSNPAYDQACDRAQQAGRDQSTLQQANQETLRLLNQSLPIIPLFQHQRSYFIRQNLSGWTDKQQNADHPFEKIERWEFNEK